MQENCQVGLKSWISSTYIETRYTLASARTCSLCNVAFTYYSHCIMCYSYSSAVACDNLETADWLNPDNAIQIQDFLRKFSHLLMLMVAVPYLLSQFKAISYSGNGTTGHGHMESKHVTIIMRLTESSGGSVEKDAPCRIHCAGRKEKLFNCFGILFCDSNFYSVYKLVHVFAAMSKLG